MYVLYNVQIIVSQFQSLSTYLFVWHLIFDIQYIIVGDVRAVELSSFATEISS